MPLSLRVIAVGGATSDAISAQGAWTRRDGLLAGLFNGETLLGLGEASPLPGFGTDARTAGDGWATDTADGALQELRALGHLRELPESAGHVARLCDEFELSSSSARFALETALLDALGRRRGVALGQLLGTRISGPRSVLVGHLDDGDILQRAERAVARGARHLKFKATGRDPDVEASRLIEVRRACNCPLRLRLDLNGGLDVAAARDALACYQRAELELVEEPTRGAALLDLGECAVPWFVDESLLQADLRGALIEKSAASGVVLKPTLLGGVTRCLSLATLAARRGKRSIVTHAFEGPVALAACAELALTLEKDTAEAAGLDLHGALSAFPSARVPQLPDAAVGDALQVDAAAVHGHGVTLCEELWAAS